MKAHESSFRDPSGFVFTEGNRIKRDIYPLYFKQYEALTSGGVYRELIEKKLLIPHEEVYKDEEKITIRPERIPFVSYPYEWSFTQYKHAALLTLKIQKLCLEHNFTLKDASAFNVTYHKGRPFFIDTLSFDFYTEGSPWRAYKQFLSHFLAPLALAGYYGADFLKMMNRYIDGIPLEFAASLLPFKSRFNLALYTHIHLPAKYETKYKEKTDEEVTIKPLSKKAQLKIIDHLYGYIRKLKVSGKTEWEDYYNHTNYDKASFRLKATMVTSWISMLKPQTVVDIGGNNGLFSRKLIHRNSAVLVADSDTAAVDQNYRDSIKNEEDHIIPIVCDILNPSPAVGFNNTERASFLERLQSLKPDICLVLALIHHLTLSGNVPFDRSAAFFAAFCKYLLLEFPSEEDSQVQFLLQRKGDFKQHFDFYTTAAFEEAYTEHFYIIKQKAIENTHRTLYLLENKKVRY